MRFRTFWAAAALIVSAGTASALTVNTIECGPLGAGSTCGDYSINLAQADDTQWAFEGEIVESTGSLTIHTYTDPYWSTGESLGNIRLNVGVYGEGSGATASWGGDPVNLTFFEGQLVYNGLFAQFLDVQDNGINFVLSWTGMKGGEAVSVVLTAVPLPAGGVLLLAALGGLGLSRRRRLHEPAMA